MSEESQINFQEKRKVATDVTKDTSPQILLFKAIDRKAFAAANGNLDGWQSAINEVCAQLPIRVKEAIESRRDEYMVDLSHWEPHVEGGTTLVSDPHAPLLYNERSDSDHDPYLRAHTYEVEFDPETGETLSVKDKWEIGGPVWLSPNWISQPEEVDYTKLNHVVHEEMEIGNLTWRHASTDIALPGRDIYPKKPQKPKPSPMN